MKFELSEIENAKFKTWNEAHLLEFHSGKHPYSGAIGGRVTFHFTLTSLGCICQVSCGHCKKSDFDITDYSKW